MLTDPTTFELAASAFKLHISTIFAADHRVELVLIINRDLNFGRSYMRYRYAVIGKEGSSTKTSIRAETTLQQLGERHMKNCIFRGILVQNRRDWNGRQAVWKEV